jgi:hypothetical protein
MTSAREELLDLIDAPNAFDRPASELEPLQLEATRELFAERRTQIPVLRRRAEDMGVDEIGCLDDVVPLLFAHTVYKSYPPSFIENGRWAGMLQWLQSLSVRETTGVDVSGVTDADDWIARLEAAGHHILATSGTSGKMSFLNHAPKDRVRKLRHWRNALGWPYLRPNQDRPFYSLGPSAGPSSVIEAARIGAELWAPPGDAHFLTDEPLRIAEIAAGVAMRRRMGDGSATPGEIGQFEADANARGRRMAGAVREMADEILDRRHEPMVLTGLWSQHLAIIERARARSIPDDDFHPKTVVAAGGGVKGISLPPDYRETVDAFYGDVVRTSGYGMTEMAQMMVRCEARRYHRAPGLVMLLLDRMGERLLTAEDAVDGRCEGRFGFLDLSFEGRWGGMISGDKVTVDFGRCPCGREGPTILDSITRWSEPGVDDHIGCAGTIDAYVRGALAEGEAA